MITTRNLVTVSTLVVGLFAGESRDPQRGAALFSEHVAPAFKKYCLSCHGDQKPQSGFNLSTREALLKGGDTGPTVVAGNPGASALLKRLRHELEPAMPFKSAKLPDEVIARISDWIAAGAPYSVPLNLGVTERPPPAKPHWAFQVPKRAAVPAVRNRQWVRNPVDAFIAAEQEKHGLTPLALASSRLLLRRVYLDLIGLPPTADEMRAFLADKSPDAYEKSVDKLLASPPYGERWGRHWMDVWRYSDGGGYAGRLDYSQRHIWHWRDWVIESLNQDKGYDRMIVEMLAGDEIAPSDPQTLRATGYLARNWYRWNRNSWLQETVDHTAMAFLGVTLKCARCHDHKYDPISNEEYYRFRAFFEPYDVRTDRVAGQPDLNKDSLPRVYDAEPRAGNPGTTGISSAPIYAQTYRFIRGDETNPDTTKPLAPGVPQILGNHKINIQPVNLPLEAYNPDLRSFVHRDLITQAKEEIEKAEAGVAKANQDLVQARLRMAELRCQTTSGPAKADLSAESPPAVVFEKEIKPIFQKNCFACHSSQTGTSRLVLETVESILRGGRKNGPAANARRSLESPLILYLRGEKKPRMPLGRSALPEAEIGRIAKWIDQLPEEDPRVKLRRAEFAEALAERHLLSARAALPALEARIAADKARFATPPDPQEASLALTAQKAERQASFLEAEENLLRAQQHLAEVEPASNPEQEAARERKVAAARQELEAAVAALKGPTETYTSVAKPYPSISTGRRLALARWITSKDNPLTARVAINHIWLRHFGKPLVSTVANFGASGKAPGRPELLDWLAVQFMEDNWSMKAVHRLIVTSNTYRMQSVTSDAKDPNVAIDPENRYLWRMNPRRMEAETVRDSVLYVAGHLDAAIGGPSVDEDEGPTSRRRSMYLWQTHESHEQFLTLFDIANPNECYARSESIVPQQALAMANSKLTLEQARRLARRLSQQVDKNAAPAAFVTLAFETILSRPPSAEEITQSGEFLAKQAELFRDPVRLTLFSVGRAPEIQPATEPGSRAQENLIHVLLNSNEFLTIQ